MINIEKPAWEGERARVALVGVVHAMETLAQGDDPYQDPDHAKLNPSGLETISEKLHNHGLLPPEVNLREVSISYLDLQCGSSDDSVHIDVFLRPRLPELTGEENTDLGKGPYIITGIRGRGSDNYPIYRVDSTNAGVIEIKKYPSYLQQRVRVRMDGIEEVFEAARRNNEETIIDVIEAIGEQITLGNATPDRRSQPYRIPWMGLDPDYMV